MTKHDVKLICIKNSIKNYTINDDLSIDVDGNVDFSYGNLWYIPLKFRNVSGNFNVYSNELESLQGAPDFVGGYFSCHHNNLSTLEFVPKEIAGNFNCSHNDIVNLNHFPEKIGKYIYIASNLEFVEDENFYKRLYSILESDNYPVYNTLEKVCSMLIDSIGFRKWAVAIQRKKTIKEIINS